MILIFFILYLLICGSLAASVLDRLFGFTVKLPRLIIGIFTVFISLGSLAGIVLLFLPLDFWTLGVVLIVNALGYVLLSSWVQRRIKNKRIDFPQTELEGRSSAVTKAAVFVFLALVLYGLYTLLNSQTGSLITTPWQTIKWQYAIVFFASTFISGLLIFSKLKTKIIIIFLILQTFLLVSYLPLSHALIYGADGWRHIANEERFLQGGMFKEAVLGEKSSQEQKLETSKFKNLKTRIGQLSYGNFWASNVFIAKVFKTDLVTITKWFLPIVWALVFPILLFEIGITLGWGRSKSLFLAWLGLLPFAFQVGGSFTLPVSFGLLVWLTAIVLILKRLMLPVQEQRWLLALAGVGLLSGYILYFILFWVAWFAAEVLLYRNALPVEALDTASAGLKKHGFDVSLRLLAITIIAIIVIPAVELIAGYSQLNSRIDWLGQVVQLFGNLTGYYLASGPRPHDISTGNIIFNQTPIYAFVPTVFTQWRWWIVAFCIGFLLVAIYGLVRVWQQKQIAYYWFASMAMGILSGYILTNYFLTGPHILARRLEGVVALFLIVLFVQGLFRILSVIKNQLKNNFSIIKLCFHIGGILLLAAAISASYSLGPDTSTVSAGQYRAAAYIWSQEKEVAQPCVLADTYPLLALEAISAKEIIGGNFPIDANFDQPERVRLYELSTITINDTLLQELSDDTLLDHCWFMGSSENFQKQGILGNSGVKVFEDTAVVRYNFMKQ